MKIIYIISLLLILLKDGNQKNNIREGTCIVMAIGTDGIIIAADSRSVLANIYGNKFYNYKDSVEKIYLINNSPIAFMGLETYGNDFLNDIADKYNSLALFPKNCLETLMDFTNYMKLIYPASLYPMVKKNVYFTGGYIESKPLIAYRYSDDEDRIYHFRNDSIVTEDPKLLDILIKKYQYKSCEWLKSMVIKTMQDYFKDSLKNKLCGGPISVIKIFKDNKTKFMCNDFSKRPKGETNSHLFQ